MKVFDWTIEDYLKAILDAMKPDYEWYTLDMLQKKDKVTIKKINELVESRKNQDPNENRNRKPLNTPEEVVGEICHDIENHIEWSPSSYLKQIDVYNVPFLPQELGGGWMLEEYCFKKYEGDIFFSSVTAGDRSAGSGRTFYIPRRLIEGHTYEEFLDDYFDKIADPRFFGLGKEAVINDGILKAFLGFTKRKPHPEVKETDLPDMTVYCISEFCRGDCMEHIKEDQLSEDKDLTKKEWEKFKNELPMVESLVVRDMDGKIPCYWGIMTDDNVFRDDITFSSYWNHYFRTGYYVAAMEVTEDSPMPSCADIWKKRVIPGRHYVTADVTDMAPSKYDEVLLNYVNNTIPEMGYLLSGAIMERMDNVTGITELYFPVK